MELLLHVEELLALGAQHALHRYARPARYDLGDIRRVDLLLYHGVALRRGHAKLLLQGVDALLGLDDLAVTYLGHLAVIALTLGLLCLDFESFDRLLVLLDLAQQVALALPLGAQRRGVRAQIVDLLRERVDTLLIALAAYGFSLDLQLPYAAVEVVDLLGHGVHLQAQARRRLVDQIDSLVGQETLRDVAVRELDGGDDSLVLDAHLVVVLVTLLQAAQDRYGILGRWLVDHDLLETALQCLVLLEILLELVERRGADGAQLAARQRRLEDVGGVHRPRRLAGPHERVDLVDEEQDLAVAGHDLLHDGFEPLLELALILRPGDQGAHVERIDDLRLEVLGHVAVDDPAGDALGDGRLADAGFAHEDRVVLRAAREDLQHAADLLVAADDRIELAAACLFVEVDGILAQRVELLRVGLRGYRAALAKLPDGGFDLPYRRALLLQQVCGGALLGDERQQQMFDRCVFVVEAAREVYRTLYHARRVARKVGLAVAARDLWQCCEGAVDGRAQRAHVDARLAQQIGRQRIVPGNGGREDVQRFEGLLPRALCRAHGCLQQLLCLDRK